MIQLVGPWAPLPVSLGQMASSAEPTHRPTDIPHQPESSSARCVTISSPTAYHESTSHHRTSATTHLEDPRGPAPNPSSSASPTPPSPITARESVLALPELLELILLELPVHELVRSRRVCTLWRQMHHTSPKLQRAAFLRASEEHNPKNPHNRENKAYAHHENFTLTPPKTLPNSQILTPPKNNLLPPPSRHRLSTPSSPPSP